MKLRSFILNCLLRLFTIFIIIIIIYIAAIFLLFDKTDTAKIDIIKNDNKLYLYVKKRSWGGLDSNTDIFVSVRKKISNKYNPKYDYCFKGQKNIYYKVSNDTIYFYIRKISKKPPDFNFSMEIIQIELSNPEYLKMVRHYLDSGIEKVFK